MTAVRFAVFAERAAKVLAGAREIQAVTVSGMSTEQLRAVLPAKAAAAADIATFEPLLYPPDED